MGVYPNSPSFDLVRLRAAGKGESRIRIGGVFGDDYRSAWWEVPIILYYLGMYIHRSKSDRRSRITLTLSP